MLFLSPRLCHWAQKCQRAAHMPLFSTIGGFPGLSSGHQGWWCIYCPGGVISQARSFAFESGSHTSEVDINLRLQVCTTISDLEKDSFGTVVRMLCFYPLLASSHRSLRAMG